MFVCFTSVNVLCSCLFSVFAEVNALSVVVSLCLCSVCLDLRSD